MAELNDSVLQFDSGIMDVNENLSNSENTYLSHSVDTNESLSPLNENVKHTDENINKPFTDFSSNFSSAPDIFTGFVSNSVEDFTPNSFTIDSNINSGSSNNFSQGEKLIDFNCADLNFSSGFGGMLTDFNSEENCSDAKDEEFHDAVQFFKDPSSLTYLENAGSSNVPSDPLITRSSLYVNFDPLHAKFFSEPSKTNDLGGVVESKVSSNSADTKISDEKAEFKIPEIPVLNVKPEIEAQNIFSEISAFDIVPEKVPDVQDEKLFIEVQDVNAVSELQVKNVVSNEVLENVMSEVTAENEVSKAALEIEGQEVQAENIVPEVQVENKIPELLPEDEVPVIPNDNDVPEVLPENDVLEVVPEVLPEVEVPKELPVSEETKVLPINEVPKVQLKNEEPKVLPENEVPKVLSENKTLEVLSINEVPKILPESKTPEILSENKTPEVLSENKTPKVLPENKTPKVLPVNEVSKILPENKTEVLSENETPKVLPENKVPKVIFKNEVLPENEVPKVIDKTEISEGILENIVSANVMPEELSTSNESEVPGIFGIEREIVNKHLPVVASPSPRVSFGNLLSFDSPVIDKNTDFQVKQTNEPPKLYTEEELQQALKIQELSMQDTFLKRQHDLELERTQRQNEMEAKFREQGLMCHTLQAVLKELYEIVLAQSEKESKLQGKLNEAEEEITKLRQDLKTSVEDLQGLENTFSDFHKRYEHCKSMLKDFTQNEANLKLQMEDLRVQLNEKDEMYKVLQSRTQEMLDKANIEVSNAKKAGDTQTAVLKAQLKKAELKISSLESDVKHIKVENEKLGSICDELMAKVSES